MDIDMSCRRFSRRGDVIGLATKHPRRPWRGLGYTLTVHMRRGGRPVCNESIGFDGVAGSRVLSIVTIGNSIGIENTRVSTSESSGIVYCLDSARFCSTAVQKSGFFTTIGHSASAN